MQFDYYSASVPASLSHCITSLEKYFGAPIEPCNGIHRYPKGLQCVDTGIRVYSSPMKSLPNPFVVASGASAVEGAEWLRSKYPKHSVTRLDAAQDFREENGWDRIIELVDPIARKAGLDVEFIGDPAKTQTKGRTMYFGSRTSDVRLMVYEKGLQMIGKGAIVDPYWVRMELKVKFRKGLKARAATFDPLECYGRSKWSQEVARVVLDALPHHIPDPSLRKSNAQQSFDHMCRQYGRVMKKMAEEAGHTAVFDRIREIIGHE